MFLRFLPYYAADDDGGSGGTDDDQGKIRGSDVLRQYGESATRIAELYAEAENKLYRLREKNRVLTQERDTLKAAQPADGGRVLSKEDAAAFDAFTALGKQPNELKQALEGAETTASELATLRRKDELHAVQAATGFDADVLGEIGAAWQFVAKDEQIEGKSAKVYYIKEGDQETRIDQHPKVQKFKKSLLPDSAQDSSPTPSPRNTSFVQQHGGTGGGGDMAERFIQKQAEKRAASPNPLLKGA